MKKKIGIIMKYIIYYYISLLYHIKELIILKIKKKMTNLTRSSFQAHPYHLVSPSPWPLYTCISLLSLTTTGVLTMHGYIII